VAARLGLRSVVIPVVGGHAGAWLVEALAARDIPTRAVHAAGETRTCLSILDRSTGRLTELYEQGLALDDVAWASFEAAVEAELATDPAGTVLAMSGSVAPGAPPGAYARVIRLGRNAGVRCAVDVGGDELRRALAEPWLVKVNAAEAAAALAMPVGGKDAAVSAARSLRSRGAGLALVSMGVAGAILVDEAAVGWRIGAPPEIGPYSVGSGDALLAGFIAALASGHPAADAARLGCAAAAANALRPGQGEIDPVDADRIAPGITLERLADPA
jgi:1-phosphofructokinase family hexose kinase